MSDPDFEGDTAYTGPGKIVNSHFLEWPFEHRRG